jgi:hypothetical protein
MVHSEMSELDFSKSDDSSRDSSSTSAEVHVVDDDQASSSGRCYKNVARPKNIFLNIS